MSAPAEPIGTGTRLADGEWHRLHPATPLLKGGIAFVAILGVIIVNLRDVFINIVIGAPDEEYDPLVWIIEHDYALLIIFAIIGGLLLSIAAFYVSWRMHTFRITDEQVEVRSGILFRTNRRGRLDRIQGINIVRPFLARLFGAAKLEINVAGQDANVQLAYLGSAAADELRREILLLASGTSADPDDRVAGEAGVSRSGVVHQRVNELLAPELDAKALAAESVVQMNLGRLIGSILLSGFTVFVVAGIIAVSVIITRTGEYFFLFGVIPTAIGLGSYYISKFTRSLRYSIASTPDGVRVGFGLLSTSNETLPPGRIHAVLVSQPLLWRPFGWWEIKINRAASSSAQGAAGQAQTTILPVGNLADARKVIELVLPGIVDPQSIALLERGLTSKGGDDGFVNSPRRAAIIRWFSWRRNGWAITPESVLLRRGAIWRELVVVPQARMQSASLRQGPLLRRLSLASVRLHTVAGPVIARLGAIDSVEAIALFEGASDAAIRSAGNDTSHRWRSGQ
ncbi:PH domain-containing protein [soil metagenome]